MPTLKFKNPETGDWQKVNVGSSYDANLSAHINNKNNPHGVTPAKIGAAPAIKYGTTDVTAGSASSYDEGTLYVVIE